MLTTVIVRRLHEVGGMKQGIKHSSTEWTILLTCRSKFISVFVPKIMRTELLL